MSRPYTALIDYHRRTKHHFHRYAAGPGYLDWDTQPEPFRYYQGAPRLPLRRYEADPNAPPAFDALYGEMPSAPVNAKTLADLLFHSFALSAWKSAGGSRWALRCNPSSGNLHPTEVYLLTDAVAGLSQHPALFHYQPYDHSLELRAEHLSCDWAELIAPLPSSAALVGLTSIVWRESWKYGERALRYCLLDLGHALAALAYSAACLGWSVALLPEVAPEKLAQLLGVDRQTGPEAEHPDCLVAVFPEGRVNWPAVADWRLDAAKVQELARHLRPNPPNVLSPSHRPWPILEETAKALHCERIEITPPSGRAILPLPQRPIGARWLIRQRRSVQRMDRVTPIACADFKRLVFRLWQGGLPVAALGREPAVHLGFYLHRVEGLPAGLYLLARSEAGLGLFRQATSRTWRWQKLTIFPEELPFYLLAEGDVRELAKALSCHQDIAADGAFAVSMLAEFEGRLKRSGWEYARLHMEAGALGQLLYLEAEAAGLRGTGIGCFFDDPVHALFGLSDEVLQVLYHFTVGGGLEDPRLERLDAYYL
nr:nitroreductase family protein [uncultured Gammaproteobacteria bacterium]